MKPAVALATILAACATGWAVVLGVAWLAWRTAIALIGVLP